MYQDDWIIHSPTKVGVSTSISVALKVLADMGFKVNLDKSALTPMQKLCWLRIEWDMVNASLSLAPDNALQTLHCAGTTSTPQLIASLVLVGCPMPVSQWRSPPPTRITVATDASEIGWGFQWIWGHQACRWWSEERRSLHINLRELMLVREWLKRFPKTSSMSVHFDMDNVTAIQCVQRQGTACSDPLLTLLEDIFAIASCRNILLLAKYVLPGERLGRHSVQVSGDVSGVALTPTGETLDVAGFLIEVDITSE
ncbi:hypothetical protein O3P69_013140 [Scylla paramamosain]|uniref:Reverse transcriptase domain-containing protein n=1 Tax=Scylla paramamosain TaxID=85552 RepID=A0AAW0TZG7_SCYPA